MDFVRKIPPLSLFFDLFLFFVFAQDVFAGLPSDGWKHITEENIRDGFRAMAWFEVVTTHDVPTKSKNQKDQPKTLEYHDRVTYRLDPDEDAYQIESEELRHIRWVTLGWKEGRDRSPFVFDLYLHGEIDAPHQSGRRGGELALRVANLDIRKFLHPSIASFSDDQPFIRLQAYFEEFSRKAKIIYPVQYHAFKAEPSDIVQDISRRISSLVLVNNCREPGNYEVQIRDGLGRYLLRGNFSFPTNAYNDMLTRFHGVGIAEQGTGIGVPNTIRNREIFRYWDSFLPWKRMKSFPKVGLSALSAIRYPRHQNEAEKEKPIRGPIEVAAGRIPFSEYEMEREVMMKSGYHLLGREPLSYVLVDPKHPPPTGFESPDGSMPAIYWAKNSGKVVPYSFRTFEDIQRYDLFLSAFDLNGVYIGKSDLVAAYDKERKSGRWHFNFRYLGGLNRFEMREWEEGYTELRLINDATNEKAIHFIFGNFRLNPGEEAEFLLGLGTQPLIASYNHNPISAPLLYAFAYSADETILDHHDRGIGVEKVYIERIDEVSYRVRLISYERILPVWEGVIRMPSDKM